MGVWLRISVSLWTGGRRIPSAIVLVGMGVVGVAVAVMVISACVVAGFDRLINEKMAWLLGHVQVRLYYAEALAWELPTVRYDSAMIGKLSELEGVKKVRPFYHKGALLIGGEGKLTGGVLRGLDLTHHSFGLYWKRGDTSALKSASRGVVLSSEQARKLGLSVGDSVLIVVKGAGGGVRVSRAPILGIYSTGMMEYDMVIAFVPLRYLWSLSGTQNVLSGYEIVLEDWRLLPSVYENLEEALPPEMGIFTLRQLNPNLYDWLSLHETNKTVLFILLLAVVFIALSSISIVIVLENASRLSLLWALGARRWQIAVIFLLAVGALLVGGVVWGDILAFSLLLIQKVSGIITLEESAYYVREVPVAFPVKELLLLHAVVIGVSVVTLVVPMVVLRRLKPAQLFRWHF